MASTDTAEIINSPTPFPGIEHNPGAWRVVDEPHHADDCFRWSEELGVSDGWHCHPDALPDCWHWTVRADRVSSKGEGSELNRGPWAH